jgi:hypothetical protein
MDKLDVEISAEEYSFILGFKEQIDSLLIEISEAFANGHDIEGARKSAELNVLYWCIARLYFKTLTER